MRLNVCLSFLLYIGAALTACAATQGPAAVQTGPTGPETEDQKILYALGQALGQNIENAGLTEDEIASVLLGLSDSALRRPSKVDMNQYGPKLQAFMNAHVEGVAAAELTQSKAFVEQQAAIKGAIRTASGIVIQEIKPGTGASPKADDTVRVHYHGVLRNGSVFDSSVVRGEPATFPLNQVIPCWTEGMQLIRVGGKARLTCPPNLAYGAEGRPGIPGNAALVFEVELLEILAK